MDYKISIDKDNYYKAVLTVFNVVSSLKLTELEIDILSTMLNNKITVINIMTREVLRKILNKDKFNINNYIRSLKNKGLLLKTTNKSITLQVNPAIISLIDQNKVSFEFTTTINND